MTRRIPRMLKTWRRQPFLHFLAVGCTAFLLYSEVTPEGHLITISRAHLEGLRQDHLRRTGTLPTAAEESALIDRLFEDEVLLREALRIGLDRGDPIVRRRLIQKMEFLVEGLNPATEPTEGKLRAYFRKHRELFEREGRISLVHVFLARNRSTAQLTAKARTTLERLTAGTPPDVLGDPFVHGSRFDRRTRKELAALFGSSFAQGLEGLPEDAWCGPIESSFGMHLVRITSRTETIEPTFAEVRQQVRERLLAIQRKEAMRAGIRHLSDRYEMRLEDGHSAKDAVVLGSGKSPST